MHDLPPELEQALKGYKDPFDGAHHAEVLADWGPILDCLRELHEAYPDWRFGQMIENLAFWAANNAAGTTYNVPDEQLLRTARSHLAGRQDQVATAKS